MRRKYLKRIGLAVLASIIITVYTHLNVVYASDLDIDGFSKEMRGVKHISNDLIVEFENWYNANQNKDDIDLDSIASTVREMSEYIDENDIESMDNKGANEILVYVKQICTYANLQVSLSEDGIVKISDGKSVIFHTREELSKSLFEDDEKKALSNVIKNTSVDSIAVTIVKNAVVIILPMSSIFAIYIYIRKKKNKQIGGGGL